MVVEADGGRGRMVGSRIRLAGRVLGMPLSVDEVVTERDPPLRKAWETIGHPRLLVIGHHRMGFEITPQRGGSLLRVFVDFADPDAAPARWLGSMFGRYYARWCARQMVEDAVAHFPSPGTRAAA